MSGLLKLGLVGLGKIARDQHLPAIAQTGGIELIAVASRNATADDVANYSDLDAMLTGEPSLDDPGINALSILTEVVPDPVILLDAMLEVPTNCDAPIAAQLHLRTAAGAPIAAVFDFRQTGPQTWDIAVEADDQQLLMSHGGNTLIVDGITQILSREKEYPAMYRHFAKLVHRGINDVDLAPLRLVADAFLCGRHCPTEAFHK